MNDSATLWTVACQAPLSTRFSRQEYWSGLPCSPLGDRPKPGIKPMAPVSPELQAGSLSLITDSMDVSLSELRELVMDKEALRAVIHGVTKSQT